MTEENKNQGGELHGEVPAKGIIEKKKHKSIGKKIVWVIISLIALVLIVQVAVADRYSAQVLVIEGEKKVGVNPTTEKLDFGDLSADTSATRFVTLTAGGSDTSSM